MAGNLEAFLKGSPVASRVKADARVVVRRFEASPRAVEDALQSGRIEIEATPICELVIGGVVVARGEIDNEDGTSRFRVTEVVE
jgi:hypothetical protein